ncbi:MAG: nucleotidyltransferase domain-containing protein [Bacteroidetes bacterium]|nr:nucleotidyltransferase domain-containing protein [Bacteroidota bacterium]
MKVNIKQSLSEIETRNKVNIVFACESGSRAWGFASPDSDYDVRFIYVHPKEYYLSVDEQRDVIELPINDLLDINGWELRKALRLFRKSNGSLYEWLQSPVVYSQNNEFVDDLKNLMPHYFSPRATMHHYLSMAKTVFENDLAGGEVRLKKYFYALRPILACRWIADRIEVPPMEFGKLRVLLANDLNEIVDDLLKQKAVVDEKYVIKPIEQLYSFIRSEIEYCEKAVPGLGPVNADSDRLNNLFRKYVG